LPDLGALVLLGRETDYSVTQILKRVGLGQVPGVSFRKFVMRAADEAPIKDEGPGNRPGPDSQQIWEGGPPTPRERL